MALIRELHPNLVLTDSMMPILSGEEMLAETRADAHDDDSMGVVFSV
jgi:hypothetical protein